jgi:hypothetical protein
MQQVGAAPGQFAGAAHSQRLRGPREPAAQATLPDTHIVVSNPVAPDPVPLQQVWSPVQ